MKAFGVHRYLYVPEWSSAAGAGYLDLWNFGPLSKGGIRRVVLWEHVCIQ